MHRAESSNDVNPNEYRAIVPQGPAEDSPTPRLSAVVPRWRSRLGVAVTGAMSVAALVFLAPPASAAIGSPTYPRTCDWDGNCSAPGGHGYGPLIPRPTGWGVNPGIGGPKPDLCKVYPDMC